MGRSPCCAKEGLNRGAWTAQEDKTLTDYIKLHGEGRWRNLPRQAGLKRCGKSCRLRWLNYLRPDIKRGNISPDEDDLIIRLHKLLGNRWSLIAGRLPGRTDNEIKNYWNTNLSKKVQEQEAVPTGSSSSAGRSEKSKNVINRPRLFLSTPNTASPSPLVSHNVVRTKAVKCTKVLIDVTQLPHNNEHKANNDSIDGSSSSTSTKPSPLENSSSTSDFIVDFDVNSELFFTNLLRSDISSDDRLFSEETAPMQLQPPYWDTVGGNDQVLQTNAVLNFQSLNSFLNEDHGDWLA